MHRIKSIENLSEKGVRNINEDQVLIDKDQRIFGVFDGASSLVPYLSPDGQTGGRIAATIAADSFRGAQGDLYSAAMHANTLVDEAHESAKIDLSKNVNRFGTTAAVVRIHDDTAELLQIGDSIIVVIYESGEASLPLGYYDQDIKAMRKWRTLADQGATDIRGLVMDDVMRQREAANIDYGLLNGDDKLENCIKTTTLPLGRVASILVLTDGMFMPKSDPNAEEDWDAYAAIYKQSGVDGILKIVREKEDSDPELLMYPRFKVHDDASAVAIDFV